jgi:Uncharacterized protein conserved in bacteria
MSLKAVHIPDVTEYEIENLDDISAEPLRQGLRYWQAARGARKFPARADIRPRDIVPILRYISLIRCERGDFVYRIVGDSVVSAFDLAMQNRKLSEMAGDEPAFGTIVRPLLERCVENGEPIALRGHTGKDLVRVNFTDYENLLLPLGPEDGKVDHIMAVSHYVSRPYS